MTISTGARAADPARARACGWSLEPSADRENILFPDKGSINPFFAGAKRTARHRSYMVRILSGKQPASGPAPNTLYDTSPDGSKSGHGFAYRIYLPDRTAGPFGGVPAPAITLVLAGGQRIPLPTCPDPLTDVGFTQALAAIAPAEWGLPKAGALALQSPVWHKYVNAPTGYWTGFTDNQLTANNLEPKGTPVTDQLPSGLGENADNKYVYSYLSQEFGEVVEFRAKLPRTPQTYDGERKMGTGQLRYWSICTGIQTTQTIGCAADEQVPVDRHRYFTVAISTTADRPTDASTDCGVTWLPWGPEPKSIAFVRNMTPSARFAQAVQHSTPGTERKTMGVYYPIGRYFSTPEAFEQSVGCHRPAKRHR